MRPDPARDHHPGPMLPALARWRNWPPTRRPVRRLRLAERFRFGRTDDRRRPVGTIFRRDRRPNNLVSSHLSLCPLTYAPQFQFALHAYVQPTNRPDTRARQRREEPVRARTQLVIATLEGVERSQSGSQMETRLALQGLAAFMPVTGVMARHIGAVSEPATREVAESVIERVIRSHRRIESRQGTSVVIREQPRVAVEVERALTSVSKRAADSPLVMPAMGMDWPVRKGPDAQNGPDLDQLTDQVVRRIDDRLTAQRERMGRF